MTNDNMIQDDYFMPYAFDTVAQKALVLAFFNGFIHPGQRQPPPRSLAHLVLSWTDEDLRALVSEIRHDRGLEP